MRPVQKKTRNMECATQKTQVHQRDGKSGDVLCASGYSENNQVRRFSHVNLVKECSIYHETGPREARLLPRQGRKEADGRSERDKEENTRGIQRWSIISSFPLCSLNKALGIGNRMMWLRRVNSGCPGLPSLPSVLPAGRCSPTVLKRQYWAAPRSLNSCPETGS